MAPNLPLPTGSASSHLAAGLESQIIVEGLMVLGSKGASDRFSCPETGTKRRMKKASASVDLISILLVLQYSILSRPHGHVIHL
jgi:hypothetical protein